MTCDIDFLGRRDPGNLDRVAVALRELRAFLRVGGLDDETTKALPVVLDGAALAKMEISTWRTDAALPELERIRHSDRTE